MTVPYIFANQTGNIPLAELDANFAALDEHANVADTVSGNAQPNITSVGTMTYLSSTGNISAQYFIGNGSQLTGIVAVSTYGNSNVAAYLPVDPTIFAINSNVVATNSNVANTNSNVARTNSNVANTNSNVANLTTSLANTNSNVANIAANVSTLQGQVYSNANVANYLPIYSGNVSANYFIGDGSLLTNLPGGNYSNSNVQSYLEVLTSNISTTGNVTANYFLGNSNINFSSGSYNWSMNDDGSTTFSSGSKLTGDAASFTLDSIYTEVIDLRDNTTTGFYTNSGQYIIQANGTYSWSFDATGNLQTPPGNVEIQGVGNDTNSISLAWRRAGNVDVTSFTANSVGGYVLVNNGVDPEYQWQFDNTGNLTTPANTIIQSESSDITIKGFGELGSNPPVAGSVNLLAGNTGTGDGGNILIQSGRAPGAGGHAGNITLSALNGSSGFDGVVTIQTDAGNNQWVFDATGNLTLPGNTSAINYANGTSILSGFAGTYNDSNVVTLLSSFGSNVVSTTGNVTANYFIGDGSQLTNLPAGNYSNANVEAYLPTSNTIISINSNVANTDSNVANLTIALANTDSNVANIVTITTNTNSNVSNLTIALANTDSNVANLTLALANTDSNVGNLAIDILTLQGQVYSNANVANYLTTYTGNISSGNISVTGNIYGNIVGNILTVPTYGSFYDTTTQTNSNVGNAIPMSYNTTDINNGITIAGAGNTEITISKTGIYNIQFSAQVNKTGGGADDIYIWLDKNGNSVPNSATAVYLVGNNSKTVAAWNFLVSATAGDYYRLMWEAGSADIEILAEAAAGDVPAIPSVILTVVPVGA